MGEKTADKDKETQELVDLLFQENLKRYGLGSVRRGDNNDIFVIVNGKERRCWVEST